MLLKRKIIVCYNRPACWLYFFSALTLFVVSCKQPVTINQEYFDSLFNKIDSSLSRPPYNYRDTDITSLDAAFAGIKNPGVGNIANKNLRKISYYRKTKSDYNTALLYADSTINLLQSHTDDTKLALLHANTLFVKGGIYFDTKNYDEAIRNYTAGKIILFANGNDPQLLYEYYNNMASVLYTQKKYLQAAEFYKMKYKTAFSKKTRYLIFLATQENMNNTGICYAKAGLSDSAEYYCNATLDYINQYEKKFPFPASNDSAIVKTGKEFPFSSSIDFDIMRSVVYHNLAGILYQQKNITAAENLYLKSIEGTRLYKDSGFTIPLRFSLIKLYLESKQLKKAGYILMDTAHLVNTAEISVAAGDYYKLLSNYYTQLNQVAATNEALMRSYAIRDSLEKRDRRFNSIDVRREFENGEQRSVNLALKKDNDIKEGYLLIALISAAMAIVIASLIWYNLKRKSAFVNKLTSLNTEVSRKNDDLQKTLATLEQSHRENNRIMRVMAHDLRSPISAIRTLVYSLLKKEQTAQIRDALELIETTCIDAIALLKDLLNNKRNLSEISKELVDMGRLIEQCTELYQLKAGEKNQQLKLEVDYPVMMLNRQKIVRVIGNIVNNAIKFSPENTEITIRLERKENSVLLSVHDNGIGIPQDLKDKIFTINDADIIRPGTAGEESYGLGLPVSRKIIEEHSGRLWFESETGKGSVFYIELPYSIN